VERLAKSCDKEQPLQLLSMGSGGLMSDFITLEKLVLAGFKEITIDCVDPEGIDEGRVKRVQTFFSEYPGAKVKMQAYKNIDEVPTERAAYASVLAVDYDVFGYVDYCVPANRKMYKRLSGAGDLIKAYRRLLATGFLALGYSNEDSFSGPKLDPILLTSQRSVIHTLGRDIIQQLPQQEKLTLGVTSLEFAEHVTSSLFAFAFAVEKSARNFRKITLLCLADCEDQDKIKQFETLMCAYFPKSEIEITFSNEHEQKCDMLFTGTIEKEFISKEYLSFIKPESTTYIMDRPGNINRQTGAQEDQRVEVLPALKN
jgi:hypothetical protein